MREREIVIRLKLPDVGTWGRRFFLVTALLVGASAVAFAVLPKSPPTFVSGNILSAADLNALSTDLTDLDGRLSKPTITVSGKKYSTQAVYCGYTPAMVNGSQGGYAGVKALCEAVPMCGSSPTAHVCTSEELARSVQLGLQPARGWYMSALWGWDGSVGLPITDCNGFTSSLHSVVGSSWYSLGVTADYCDASLSILCCD
jgi:hypothetical protein